MLDRVTITGADDKTSVADLEALSAEFPFVEWAILVAPSRGYGPRRPSPPWQEAFAAATNKSKMAASCHVCGRWVVDIMSGHIDEGSGLDAVEHVPLLSACRRIQLNFHGAPHATPMRAARMSSLDRTHCFVDSMDLMSFRYGSKQFIFQADGSNDDSCRLAIGYGIDAVPLFDCSHGAGVLPSEWPKADFMGKDGKPVYHGYAGGLGPDTLAAQLPRIIEAAGAARSWVDMETRVRTDRTLDMSKVRRCLEICAPYVQGGMK